MKGKRSGMFGRRALNRIIAIYRRVKEKPEILNKTLGVKREPRTNLTHHMAPSWNQTGPQLWEALSSTRN